MNATVKRIVELLFEDIELDEETSVLQEELLQNCQERFEDLTARGLTEDEAIAAVVDSLKGMQEVLDGKPRKQKSVLEKATSMDGSGLGSFSPEDIHRIETNLFSADIRIEASSDNRFSISRTGSRVKWKLENGTLHIQEDPFLSQTPSAVEWKRGDDVFIRLQLDKQDKKSAETTAKANSWQDLFRGIGSLVRNAVSAGESSVTICLPESIQPELMLSSRSGDITIVGVPLSSVRADTISGDVDIRAAQNSAADSLAVSSTSGDLEIRASAVECRMKTMSGDIEWEGRCDSLKLTTTSGDADISGDARTIRAQSVSGDLDFSLDSARELQEIQATTTSGDVDIELPDWVDSVELQTKTVSGDITVHNVRQMENAPLKIQAASVSGDITVR